MTAHQTITDDQIKKSKLIAGSGGGGGGGGGSEKDDNLESTSTLTIVELLGEGQIGGLVNKSPSSIFLNDTPLASSTGQYNFKNVNWGIVDGTQGQASLGDGFNEVESSFNVNSKVTKTSPAKITVTDPNADKIRVIVSTPALIHTDKKGNIGGSEVQYRFTISLNNGPFSEIGTGRIKGKTRSKYQRQYTYDLPKKTLNGTKVTMWTIQMERITDDSNSSSTSNDLFLDNYSVITASRLTYPNSAVVGISFDAEQFSGVPTRSYLVDGLIIRVPSNRDSITRDYLGTWDGTFKLAVCDNPAWILYDLLTNKRYGLGNYVPAEYANPARLYTIGKYCDQMVDDGYGKKEPRFTINTCINTRMDAHQLISEIASVFNGMAYWTGNQMGYMCDMPTPVTMIYNAANVVNGEFQYSGAQRKDMHSIVLVTYNDPENNYEPAVEYVEDAEMIDRFGIRKVEITAFGCTSRAQAQRVGRWMLYTERHQSKTVSFKVGIDSAFVMPGDVIKIADPNRAGQRQGGRLISCTKTSAILDGKIEAPAGSSISIRLEDGTFADRLIGTVADYESNKSVVTWVTELTKLPVGNAVWVIKTPELEPMIARVVAVGQGETIGEFSITAVQHNESKFDHIEKDILLDIPNVSKIEPSLMTAPESVEITTESRIDQGIAVHNMVISWNQVKNAIGYEVQYRKDDGNWLTLPIAKMPLIEIANVFQGSYTAKVAALSSNGAKSPFTWSLPTVVDGQVAVLPKPGLLTATPAMFSIVVEWEYAAGTTGVAFTELEVSEDGGSTFTLLTTAPDPTKQYIHNGLALGNVRFYRARVVDKYGFKSPWSDVASASPDNDASKVLEVLENKIGIDYLSDDVRASMNDAAEKARIANEAIAKEVSDRAAAIVKEQTDRANAITSEATARANAISTAITKEVNDRNSAIAVETSNRVASVKLLNDGLTKETTERKADTSSLLSNIETFKASTNDSLASVQQKVNVNTTNISAQATQITGIDSRLGATESAAATAQTTANTAVSKANANASNITSISASLGALDSESLVPDYALANPSSWMSHYSSYNMAPYFKTTTTGKITNTVFRKDTSNPANCFNYNVAPLSNTKAYKISCWIRRSADSTGTVGFTRLMGTPNGEFSTVNYAAHFVSPNEIPANETWTYVERIIDVSSQSAQYPRVKFGFLLGHTGTVGWWELQGYKVTAVIGAADTDNTVATTSALNTLDTKVTNVDGKVTTNTNAITSLTGRVTTAENALVNKADSSALNAYSTKTETNTAIASGISQYDANLRIGGVNVLANSEGERTNTAATNKEYLMYERSAELKAFYDENLGNPVTISFEMSTPVVGTVQVYSSNNSAHTYSTAVTATEANKFVKYQVTVTPQKHPSTPTATQSTLEFYGVYGTGRIPTVRKVQVEAGNKATAWSPSPRDVKASLDANASAISTTDANVAALDGRVTSSSNEITTLKNRVNLVEGAVSTKAESSAVQTLDSRVTAAEGSLTSQSGNITKLQNDLAVSAVASDNILMKSNVPGSYAYGKYPHVVYEGYEDMVVGDTYTVIVCWEHKRGTGDTNSALAIYAGGGSQSVGSINGGTAGTGKIVSKYTFVKNGAFSPGLLHTIRFYMLNQPGSDKASVGEVYWAVLVRGASINTDRWIPSKYDLSSSVTANSNAIQSLTSTVNTIDGKVVSNTNAITNLSNRVTTAEGNITSTSNAVNTLTSRVTAAEGSISSQGSQITSLNNNLVATTNTANAALPQVVQSNGNYKLFRSVLAYENNTVNLAGNIVIQTPITINAKMFKIIGSGYNYTDNKTDISFTVGGYAFNNSNIIRHSATNTGSIPMRIRLGIRNSTVCLILSSLMPGNTWQYPKLNLDAEIGYVGIPINWAQGWSAEIVIESDLASYGITGIVEPSQLDMGTEISANASAISSLTNIVTQQGNSITSQSSSITSLQNSISTINSSLANKAETSAVNNLSGRVTAAEGSITSLSNQTTSLSASITKTINEITINDTRADNQPPSWYWANYPKRKVIEFKSASALGLTGMGTYVSLESLVQWTDSSGGSIKQVARSGDELNAQHRYSVGNTSWSAWKPYIKELTDQGNANATAINTLNSQVTTINGTITAQSTAITKLQAAATISEIKVTGVSDALVGAILYGTELPTVTLETEATSASNKVIRFGDNSGVDYTAYCNGAFVAIDPNKLYRFKYRYRRVTGDGGVYLFIQCANADKSLNVTAGNTTIAITSISSANYVVSNAKPALNTWVEGEYYFKGKSTGASSGSGTISSPRTFPALAAFIRVGGLFNYNTGPGQQDLDYIMVEDFDAGAQGDSTATALNTLDAKVTTIDGKVTTQATSLNSLSTTVNGQTTTINNQATTINGIKGVKTLTIDTNGVISGYGLVSELIDGKVVSNFGINATNFFIGPPSSNKKPFIVTTTSQTINGVTYPAGTWIDTAYIASASIKLAHIDSATIKELQAGTVTTVSADGSKRITSGAVDRLYAPNGNLVLEIGILD